MVRATPISKKFFIDLNGHVGIASTYVEAVHGGFGGGGDEVLDFVVTVDFLIANAFL
jgi:hypothetical protein